jgi:hypothetical protein
VLCSAKFRGRTKVARACQTLAKMGTAPVIHKRKALFPGPF